jgi:hypothetical protein
MNISNLVGIHEAGIAHHVAAVREIDGEHRSAAVLDRTASVVVKALIAVRRNVSAGEILLNPFQELDVNGHQIFGSSMLGAVLYHPDLAISLNDVRLNFADLLMQQLIPFDLAINDGFSRFLYALRA